MSEQAVNLKRELAEDIARFADDPLGHVLYCYPWGESGTELENESGPRKWQREFLNAVGQQLKAGKLSPQGVIQEAVASGHGIGKSALVAWLIKWAIDTFEDTRVVVTANTDTQLRTKTWPELSKWHRLALTRDWFTLTATSLYSNDAGREKTWRCDLIPWNETQPEAFAGLHNKGRRIVLIFDEASSIADKIWEVAEGALTDDNTEIIWAVFGNPTRNTGRFRECFGKRRHRWSRGNPWQIDSRTVEGTNKKLFEDWIADNGEDSDFVKVRVRGQFPNTSVLQLIPYDVVLRAQKVPLEWRLDDPIIMAVDVARGGDDFNVIRFRRGMDARSIPRTRIPGSATRDTMLLVSKIVELADKHKPDVIFLDATGVGGPVADRLRQLGYNVIDVQFGSESPNPKYANKRAWMWWKTLEAMRAGAAIDDDPILESDLTSVEYTHDKKDRIILESKESMKKRGLASPDEGDALCMLWAEAVPPKESNGAMGSQPAQNSTNYNPYSQQEAQAAWEPPFRVRRR